MKFLFIVLCMFLNASYLQAFESQSYDFFEGVNFEEEMADSQAFDVSNFYAGLTQDRHKIQETVAEFVINSELYLDAKFDQDKILEDIDKFGLDEALAKPIMEKLLLDGLNDDYSLYPFLLPILSGIHPGFKDNLLKRTNKKFVELDPLLQNFLKSVNFKTSEHHTALKKLKTKMRLKKIQKSYTYYNDDPRVVKQSSTGSTNYQMNSCILDCVVDTVSSSITFTAKALGPLAILEYVKGSALAIPVLGKTAGGVFALGVVLSVGVCAANCSKVHIRNKYPEHFGNQRDFQEPQAKGQPNEKKVTQPSSPETPVEDVIEDKEVKSIEDEEPSPESYYDKSAKAQKKMGYRIGDFSIEGFLEVSALLFCQDNPEACREVKLKVPRSLQDVVNEHNELTQNQNIFKYLKECVNNSLKYSCIFKTKGEVKRPFLHLSKQRKALDLLKKSMNLCKSDPVLCEEYDRLTEEFQAEFSFMEVDYVK